MFRIESGAPDASGSPCEEIGEPHRSRNGFPARIDRCFFLERIHHRDRTGGI